MKQFKKILALVMTMAMIASMFVFSVSAASASIAELDMPHAINQAIVIDGEKDLAYENATVLECGAGVTPGILDGKAYFTYDKDNLYVFFEVYDGTVDATGADGWDADCVEVFVDINGAGNMTQYRVDRFGAVSDAAGKTGAECQVTCDAAAKDMANGNGWTAEIAISLEGSSSDKVSVAGFVNEKGSGKYAYLGALTDTNSVWNTCYTLNKTADLYIPLVDADSIELDAAIDAGYAESPALLFTVGDGGNDRDAMVEATVYAAFDGAYLYVVGDIYDPVVNGIPEGGNPWDSDEIELFLNLDGSGSHQYRIDRDGNASDENGKIVGTDDCVINFECKVAEKADGTGWIAEYKIPTTSANFAMGGFVQDAGTWAVNYFGTAATVEAFNFTAVEKDIDVVYDAEAVTLTTGTAVALMPDGAIDVNRDTEGLTYWFRVSGLKEPMTLSCPQGNITTKHFDPVFIYEEDGVTNKLDEFGNKMVERDADGNVVYVGEDLAQDFTLSTYNHGQDGMRNASWTIERDGDYLVYIPFKVYSLSHQFQGIDYVTSVSSFSIKALQVSTANAEATMQPMGVFENKLESYSATLVTDTETVNVFGVYDYMNSNEPNAEINSDITGNVVSSEYYDPNYGYNLNKKNEDGTNDDTYMDYTQTIMTTWQIAYVDAELPETVGGKATSDIIWVDNAQGGNAAIPNHNNYMYEAETVTVTFMNEGEEYKVVTILYGADATVTKPKKSQTDWFTYKFDKWVDAEGNVVDVTAVTEDITVYATYTETFRTAKWKITDAKEGDWYFEAVKWAVINNVMNGVSETKFDPNGTATRAMIVTVLYRMQGEPNVEGMTHPFTDVAAGQWYTNAIIWAYNNGVVNGMTANTFAPNGNVTREQFATILYRYAKEIEKKDVTLPEDTKFDDKYTDVAEISSWATDAMLWTNVNGYIGGMTATTIGSKGNATRAQLATILGRYVGGIAA